MELGGTQGTQIAETQLRFSPGWSSIQDGHVAPRGKNTTLSTEEQRLQALGLPLNGHTSRRQSVPLRLRKDLLAVLGVPTYVTTGGVRLPLCGTSGPDAAFYLTNNAALSTLSAAFPTSGAARRLGPSLSDRTRSYTGRAFMSSCLLGDNVSIHTAGNLPRSSPVPLAPSRSVGGQDLL